MFTGFQDGTNKINLSFKYILKYLHFSYLVFIETLYLANGEYGCKISLGCNLKEKRETIFHHLLDSPLGHSELSLVFFSCLLSHITGICFLHK